MKALMQTLQLVDKAVWGADEQHGHYSQQYRVINFEAAKETRP